MNLIYSIDFLALSRSKVLISALFDYQRSPAWTLKPVEGIISISICLQGCRQLFIFSLNSPFYWLHWLEMFLKGQLAQLLNLLVNCRIRSSNCRRTEDEILLWHLKPFHSKHLSREVSFADLSPSPKWGQKFGRSTRQRALRLIQQKLEWVQCSSRHRADREQYLWSVVYRIGH